MSARVWLGDIVVGELRPDPASQSTAFEFDAAYVSRGDRPIFGRWYEDQILDPPREFRGSPLPTYFRNLLPEGALRKIVEARLKASALPEYTMLLRLGEHLPGAVRVLGDQLDPNVLEISERESRAAGDPFRFALTGVQPKLSLAEAGDRLTMPLEGQGGDWIAKFGSPAYRDLVRNELTVLDWAHACGLDVPERRLIRASQIEHLPQDFEPDQEVLIVRRFDRGADGARIHQEDFAQVFDVAPEERYAAEIVDLGWAHYGSIAAVVRAICGEADFREYMRRLVFMVLAGNADAHLKNWALYYPDGLVTRLAPLYDFVATVAYSNGDRSALRWVEPAEPTIEPTRRLTDITMDDLIVVASSTEVDTANVLDDISAFAAKVRATWPEAEATAPESVRRAVTAHLTAAALK
ncbi:MAG: type II toxin-antitoxin system HipA family toxin [Deltaproteobacteria bacterium]|nr:type II toxin-antitoxin system HipA family toxin [Deltaproteobacteria bacterium]